MRSPRQSFIRKFGLAALAVKSSMAGRRQTTARSERRDVSRLPQHHVDFRGVQLFDVDHLPRELLERDRGVRHGVEQLAVEAERMTFGVERLAQHRADVGLVRIEQRADRQRRVGTQGRAPLADLLRMNQRFVRLGTQPRDDGNAAEAEDHERVVRVRDDAGELGFEQPVQDGDDFLGFQLLHRRSFKGKGPHAAYWRRRRPSIGRQSSHPPPAWTLSLPGRRTPPPDARCAAGGAA